MPELSHLDCRYILNFFTVASLVLGTLKLLGLVGWPWLWVLAPAGLSVTCEMVVLLWFLSKRLLAWRLDRW